MGRRLQKHFLNIFVHHPHTVSRALIPTRFEFQPAPRASSVFRSRRVTLRAAIVDLRRAEHDAANSIAPTRKLKQQLRGTCIRMRGLLPRSESHRQAAHARGRCDLDCSCKFVLAQAPSSRSAKGGFGEAILAFVVRHPQQTAAGVDTHQGNFRRDSKHDRCELKKIGGSLD